MWAGCKTLIGLSGSAEGLRDSQDERVGMVGSGGVFTVRDESPSTVKMRSLGNFIERLAWKGLALSTARRRRFGKPTFGIRTSDSS
jgi:hypothetical protein